MSVINKLCTLARGRARASAQVVLDANAQQIFEQEILDVEKVIQDRKHALTELITSRKLVERDIESVQNLIGKREFQARRLIEQNENEELVEDIAKEIADHETTFEALEKQRKACDRRIHKTELSLQKALRSVSNYRRDLRMAKVQQLSASSNAGADSLPRQLSELEKTRDHLAMLQSLGDDRDDAWEEMIDSVEQTSIDSRLEDAGYSEKQDRVNDVLARLRKPA